MSEGAWVSYAMAESDLILMMTHNLWPSDKDKAIESENKLKKGQPLSAEECPIRIWADPDTDRVGHLPDLFNVEGHYFISEKAANIIEKFDLGAGSLFPVSQGAFESDNKTPIPGRFFCWVFGNVKQAFLADETERKRPFGVSGTRWSLPVLPQDGDIAVSKAALEGADVWLDPILFKSIFVSGALGDALDEAGLAEAFRLKKCRIF